MIPLIQPNKPDQDKLEILIHGILDSGIYSNHGELVEKLETKVRTFLGTKKFLSTANGTISLQLALRALAPKGNVVTTPYSYVATCNAIEWQGLEVRFADLIDGSFFCDPDQIESLIDAQTSAIMLTHVYGLCGPIDAYLEIGKRRNIPVIFDAAHAFGVELNNRPISQFGEVSSFSFHATKTFHTVEGGGLAMNDLSLFEKLYDYRSFGHRGDEYRTAGINAKMSEVHAAFGLAQWDDIPLNFQNRKRIYKIYDEAFSNLDLQLITVPHNQKWNYCYFPILLETEELRDHLKADLEANEILSRKYFHPSLNTLPQFLGSKSCPNSEQMAGRVLCIPFHTHLKTEDQEKVINAVKSFFKK